MNFIFIGNLMKCQFINFEWWNLKQSNRCWTWTAGSESSEMENEPTEKLETSVRKVVGIDKISI